MIRPTKRTQRGGGEEWPAGTAGQGLLLLSVYKSDSGMSGMSAIK